MLPIVFALVVTVLFAVVMYFRHKAAFQTRLAAIDAAVDVKVKAAGIELEDVADEGYAKVRSLEATGQHYVGATVAYIVGKIRALKAAKL